MIDFNSMIKDFWEHIDKNKIDIYNEFSLQHELGIFLRNRLTDYKVQFERNVSFFNIAKEDMVKHEIDIVIYKADMSEKYAIELKFPRHGQYPERMFSFIKDIVFMEELKKDGFTNTYVLTLVEGDKTKGKGFYSGDVPQGSIYSFFRTVGNNGQDITGIINKPTGANKANINLSVQGTYKIKWEDTKICNSNEQINCKYYFLRIQ